MREEAIQGASHQHSPKLLAISGVKNSGKTTLISRLIPELSKRGLKVATVKHDGHDFEADRPGTDTHAHLEAGAYGAAIFSDSQYMVTKQQQVSEQELFGYFEEADLILLEGFKGSQYPKIEIVREDNSKESVCQEETLIAIASDFDLRHPTVKIIDLNDTQCIIEHILQALSE
ncbi:MAG: molybdopterin-guanine dinucleotide biosynthesis protein B [Cellulosilyticaceae bacterium]